MVGYKILKVTLGACKMIFSKNHVFIIAQSSCCFETDFLGLVEKLRLIRAVKLWA